MYKFDYKVNCNIPDMFDLIMLVVVFSKVEIKKLCRRIFVEDLLGNLNKALYKVDSNS